MNFNRLQRELQAIELLESREERARECRALLAESLDAIYEQAGEAKPKQATLLELIESPTVSGFLADKDITRSLHYVRILGLNAEHGREVRRKEAETSLANMGNLLSLLEARQNGTVHSKPISMSEAETRRLYIDQYLQEAGWDVLTTNNLHMAGKAGVEIEVTGMPNPQGLGYCDYVLYGRDGKPLAVIEAKKTSVSPEKGRHQVNLYGDCMEKQFGRRPVLYYTNGYEIKVMDGIYPDRAVAGFHTIADLELIMSHRERLDISDMKVNDAIANRHYQKRAITSICERLNQKQRRGLLVMATGTGKTRTAIALVDILARNSWVKNVLFLADRTSLVRQAKRNFGKLLPHMSSCELSGSGERDLNARLMFSTYQSMINYIDAEDKHFSIGRFDLIIIDEAHRSIFNRYRTIFDYFDSFLIGLTATPRNEVDANTYHTFGCEAGTPNFDYSLENAVEDGYLVSYKVINRTTKLLREGIKWEELTQEERDKLEAELGDDAPSPEQDIPGSKMFRVLFNEDTCQKILEELMTQGLRINGGETIGKSIIFAYNHKHAQMIVECFHKLYPQFPANTCQLVDNYVTYAEDLVVKFDEDPEFRIAVSVDMLDTGVDVPEVLNLVFFKPVHSKIKFIQMIGRGTRLCEHLFGYGRHKQGFLIFDYCGNFEYFNQHQNGAMPATNPLSLSQKLFNLRLDMVHALQDIRFQEAALFKAFYSELRDGLYKEVLAIKTNSSRIQVRAEMEYVDRFCDETQWQALSAVDAQIIKLHLTPLLDSGLDGDFHAISFDCLMHRIMLELVAEGMPQGATRAIKKVCEAARFLLEEKASVPQVCAKADDLRLLMSEHFWQNPDVPEVERLRKDLRELMQFLQGDGGRKVDIDIEDEIEPGAPLPDQHIDIRSYRQKVIDYLMENMNSPAIHKIHHLERINHDDLMELERILWQELGTQEDYEKERAKTHGRGNLAAFVRSLVGLSQEAVNLKFGHYLNGTQLNAQQQEFVYTVINYVRENGDIEKQDMLETMPFNEYDLADYFGNNFPILRFVLDELHECVVPA